jgi:thioredoxin reductase (NADPH)
MSLRGDVVRNPVIMAVDDEVGVLHAVERDLRSHYSGRFRIMAAESGESALGALRELKVRGNPVALLLVDQRMPGMSGTEFTGRALELFPEVKRVLLTAYADTEAAIHAINDVQIDYYLLKPWDPPEERLYPVLDDLLDDWLAAFRPPFEGMRVVGHRWSAASHQLKDFLGRNQVPYQWLDVEVSQEARAVAEASGHGTALPLVLLPDGEVMRAPSIAEVAARIGMTEKAELPYYDLVVVGAGPAGLAAAVYGASEGLHTLLIEAEAPGGQAGMSSRIENYLGFPSGLSGGDLARRGLTQAKRLGAEILTPQQVTALRVGDGYKILTLASGDEVNARALLLSTGVSYRRLDAPGVEQCTGAGIYYGAALSEAASVAGEDIYIVGGANSAGQAAVFFSAHARTVTILVRGASLEDAMSQYLVEQIHATANITVAVRSEVAGVGGTDRLQSITIRDIKTGEEQTVPATAMFVFIGAIPHTQWLDGVVARDEYGFILTGADLVGHDLAGWPIDRPPHLLEGSVPGVFAAGDVRHGSVKRVASAVGEGSVAVMSIHHYLSEA